MTTGWGSATYAADVQPGETVVIVGCGGVGINAVQGAAHGRRACTSIVVDPVAFKREQAELFGATHTASSLEEAAAAGDGPDVGRDRRQGDHHDRRRPRAT